MNVLRLEADAATAKLEELQARVKVLQHENLSKEREITSLQHKNNLFEGEVEKLETSTKDLKTLADNSASPRPGRWLRRSPGLWLGLGSEGCGAGPWPRCLAPRRTGVKPAGGCADLRPCACLRQGPLRGGAV